MPGPAPSKNARRRNARPDWRKLPAAGREDDPPEWPIPGRAPPVAVLHLWNELWHSPQAVVWAELGWTRVVARYARLAVTAEKPSSPATLLTEARQLEDRLGLTPMSMKRLQWEIEETAVADVPAGVASLDDYRNDYGTGTG